MPQRRSISPPRPSGSTGCTPTPTGRSRTGRKLVLLEDCSPDILRLQPAIRRCGARLCLKNSPLFDAAEALRLFPAARIEAVSLHGECKELLVYDDGTARC